MLRELSQPQRRIYSVSALLLAFLGCAYPSYAQLWQRKLLAANSRPLTVNFYDAAHGVVEVAEFSHNYHHYFYTTNAGDSWSDLGADTTIPYSTRLLFHQVSMPDNNIVFRWQGDAVSLCTLGQHPVVRSLISIDESGSEAAGIYMYSNGQGFQCIRLHSGVSGDSVSILKTSDSAQSFYEKSSIYLPSPPLDARDFLMLDSSNGYIFGSSNDSLFLIRTRDGWNTWQSVAGLPSKSQISTLVEMTASSDGRSLYLLASEPGSNTDYLRSEDGGSSWSVDSSFGSNRVYMLCSASSNDLWAFVGHHTYYGSVDLAASAIYLHSSYADSICLSTDRGRTWLSGGNSFIGDTLADMDWPDSSHGYVLSYKDSSTYISRSGSEGSFGVSHAKNLDQEMRLTANPAREILGFTVGETGVGTAELYTVLGTKIRSNTLGIRAGELNRINIAGLPPSCYTLVVSINGRRFVQKIVAME